jgi:hypothetical protein
MITTGWKCKIVFENSNSIIIATVIHFSNLVWFRTGFFLPERSLCLFNLFNFYFKYNFLDKVNMV